MLCVYLLISRDKSFMHKNLLSVLQFNYFKLSDMNDRVGIEKEQNICVCHDLDANPKSLLSLTNSNYNHSKLYSITLHQYLQVMYD